MDNKKTFKLSSNDAIAAKDELKFLMENVLRHLANGESVTTVIHTLQIRLIQIKSRYWKSTQQRQNPPLP